MVKKRLRNLVLCLSGLLLLSALAVETVERLVINPRIVSSWSALVGKYFEYREQYGPIVPPSISYEDAYSRLLAKDFSFLNEQWQFRFEGGSYYVAEGAKGFPKLKEPLHILILEDVQRSEIIVLSSKDGERYKGEALFLLHANAPVLVCCDSKKGSFWHGALDFQTGHFNLQSTGGRAKIVCI